MNLEKLFADCIQVVEHDLVLNDVMRFRAFVELTAKVSVYRPGIDPPVDLEQRHTDVFTVLFRQRPKTAMSISVLGADARMHDKRSLPGN